MTPPRFRQKPARQRNIFVGKQLGIIGTEYDLESQLSAKELLDAMQETEMNFQQAGIQAEPKLLLQIEIDA